VINKNFKINDKIILKANQTTPKKVLFELHRSNFSEFTPDQIKKIILEALEEFM